MNARQKKNYKKSPDTLIRAILSLQKKLEDNEAQFLEEPLRVMVETGEGNLVPRANPFVQEYRAMIRDFSAAVKAYKDITGDKDESEVSSLDSIRACLKVAK